MITMGAMAENFGRITIRLKPHEKEAFGRLMAIIRTRAGYDVPATEVVKSLMGFNAKLAPLSEEDRAVLKNKIERKFNRV